MMGIKSKGTARAHWKDPVPITPRLRPSVFRLYKACCKRRKEFVGEATEKLMAEVLREDSKGAYATLLRKYIRLDRECLRG